MNADNAINQQSKPNLPPGSKTTRIAKNTIMLYIRQILIMLVSLYTVRVVLNTLGVEDYGIYNVVGGVVSFFSFLSGTLASATQRFFSFALGQGDQKQLKKIFTVNLLIFGLIAVIILILSETVGFWFVNNHLNVPEGRLDTVLWLYQFIVFNFLLHIIATPFIAILIAHEDMQIYALVSIFNALFHLLAVLLLGSLPWDKLLLYGILLFIVAAVTDLIYVITCFRKYEECQIKEFYWDKSLFKEILDFTSWTLFGQLTTVFRNQAVTILLNQYFSPVVVAARAIASNVASQINVFASNFNVGLYPSIIKSYASNDKEGMLSLVFRGSKLTFFLMWVFALPLFIEMELILNVWLNNLPQNVVLFTRLAIVETLIMTVSLPLTTAARAPGRMKLYELSLGSIQILIFIVSFVALNMGSPAYSVYVVAIAANIVMFFIRLILMRKLIGFPIRKFIASVLLPLFKVVSLSAAFAALLNNLLPTGLFYSFSFAVLSVIISAALMYIFGLNYTEKSFFTNFIICRAKQISS